MADRMKGILAYSTIVFIFLLVWYTLDISNLMGNGPDLIASPTLSFVAIAMVTGFFFDFLVEYTGLTAVKTAMTMGAVRILFYDIFGIMSGSQDITGAVVDILFTLILSYVAGKTYEKVTGQTSASTFTA
ncbi:MAG TPA: hypothetical protein EYQ69_02345 [Gemmatimonadetes bacterium]|jgi:hypothetical protein|nr:hypothetical protein [Gemmatimonadota bacterium]